MIPVLYIFLLTT